MYVYVVTYWKKDGSIEPVVTVFSTSYAAYKCRDYFKGEGYEVCIDTAPVLGDFKYSKEEKKVKTEDN